MTHDQLSLGMGQPSQNIQGFRGQNMGAATPQHASGMDPRFHQASPQDLQMHAAHTTAGPAPIQPGGAGPLSGLRDGLTAPSSSHASGYDDFVPQHPPQPQSPPHDPMAAPPLPHQEGLSSQKAHLAQMTAQAFQNPSARPSFPAAPSKVLAEQYAKGGDGHIRQRDQVPAFETPLASGTLLEGVYPAPETPVQSTPSAAIAVGEAGRSPRPSPRLQHMDPALQAKLSGVGEPDLAETPLEQPHASAATAGAFWRFEAGRTSQGNTRGHRRWIIIAFAMLVLVALLGVVAWSQFRANTQIITPVFIAAPTGPERIVPKNPGGLQIENQDIGILNPEVRATEPNLAILNVTNNPVAIDPSSMAGIPSTLDEAVVIEEEFPAEITAVQGGTATQPLPPAGASPTVDAVAAPGGSLPENVPLPRPTALFAAATAQPIEAAQFSNSLVITSPPSGIYAQEGSYLALSSAETAYAALRSQAGSRLSGISPLYHQININGQTRYRLYLTGFASAANAELLGATLGRNQDSWIVRGG